jgi:hypothetical protein
LRLEGLSSTPRDDSKGEQPGSERGDEEERLWKETLSEEDRAFLEMHKGLGNSQKAEVAWLEKMHKETGNDGYLYEEIDVRDFLTDFDQEVAVRDSSPLLKFVRGSFVARSLSRQSSNSSRPSGSVRSSYLSRPSELPRLSAQDA